MNNTCKRFNSPFARSFLFYIAILIFIIPQSTQATDTPTAKTAYKWQIDDYAMPEDIDEMIISPDGNWLAWTINRWDKEQQSRYQEISLTPLDKKGEDIRLTRGIDTYSSIQWVPGVHRISFKTGRTYKETKPENVWIMQLNGGEPYPVTSEEKGVDKYGWLDKNHLLYLASETPTLREKTIEERKDTSIVVEDEEYPEMKQLFLKNIDSGETTRLTTNTKPVSDFWISEDKKQVIYKVDMSVRFGQDQLIPPRYFLLTLDKRENKEILVNHLPRPDGRFFWDKENTGFYFTVEYCTHPIYTMASVAKVYYYNLANGSSVEVNLDWDRYAFKYGPVIQPIKDGFWIKLADGTHFKHALYTHSGNTWKRSWIENKENENMPFYQISNNGNIMVYEVSNASTPSRYFLANIKGNTFLKQREIIKTNSPFFERPLAKSEIRSWTGAKNEKVEGILFYPINYEAGKQYPLIVMIHGGPNDADMDLFESSWLYPDHMWCERGVFVLKINYHGSANYGLNFGESIQGHYYEYEVPDIEAGVDMLIAEGKADKDKLGIIGHSNGSILGTALTLNSSRYKVSSNFAGDVNWTSDYGNCEFGVAFDNYYLEGPPWKKKDIYIEKSPLFQMEKITTPTIIFHGDKDRAVPYSQGWEYYRALQAIGKTPVRFISFPGEAHVPRKVSHIRRKLTEEIAWFEKYLFNSYQPKNNSIKPKSPIESLKKVRTFAQSNGLYGILTNNILVPETVEYEKINVTRFEITRAQWAYFDKNYSYDSLTGNYPITGISYEKAIEYAAWLEKTTGKTFRLPSEEEGKTLYKKPTGNTLDYWAGYEVSPDDYMGLLQELKTYGDIPILLKPVGSFSFDSETDTVVYDLGGNASEWVTFKEGKGKPMGGCAALPADQKTNGTPLPQYIGFRLITGK